MSLRDARKGRHECVLTINPGDWGIRFLLLEGAMSAFNRSIVKSHARKMKNGWGIIQDTTELQLLRVAGTQDQFWILDGQHRIFFASHYLEGITLRAVIYDSVDDLPRLVDDDLPEDDGEDRRVANFVRTINCKSKNFTFADHLNNYKGISPWVKVFTEDGIPMPSFTSGKGYAWTSIIRAYCLSKESITMPCGGSSNTPTMLLCWIKTPEDEIRQAAKAILWWRGMAQYAQEVHSLPRSRFTACWAYSLWLFAFIIWNQNDPDLLKSSEVKARMEHASIKSLKGLSHSKLNEMQDILLSALNYKVYKNVTTMFGSGGPGRENSSK